MRLTEKERIILAAGLGMLLAKTDSNVTYREVDELIFRLANNNLFDNGD